MTFRIRECLLCCCFSDDQYWKPGCHCSMLCLLALLGRNGQDWVERHTKLSLCLKTPFFSSLNCCIAYIHCFPEIPQSCFKQFFWWTKLRGLLFCCYSFLLFFQIGLFSCMGFDLCVCMCASCTCLVWWMSEEERGSLRTGIISIMWVLGTKLYLL